MPNKGQIMAVNTRIRNFCDRHKPIHGSISPVDLAKARFAAKFECPESSRASERRQVAWDRWIGFDEDLPQNGILGPSWAKARLLVHEILSDFRMGELVFTNGSQFEPLGNHLSVAWKLSEKWTITPDCFELFAKYAFWHRALKHSVKKRFMSYCTQIKRTAKELNRLLWNRFRKYCDVGFRIFKFKLNCVVQFVQGNRWSTVPKNNLKDRSICLEPLCNMLVQRAIGLGLRKSLKEKLGIDLDTLAEKHRYRISDPKVATIDLSDCSDAVSVRLIKYLLPKRVLNKVLASRSEMTLGPDDSYYLIRKVSSMGNGFTFDLMTVVLTALTRSFDPSSTVFGDDIIVAAVVGEKVIESLQVAGFVVNQEKTNINTGYRESCGAHFVDNYGYVTSFDQRWLNTPHDLIVALNKVAVLAAVYGEPFESLRAELWSCVSPSYLGATIARPIVYTGKPPAYELDTYVRYGPVQMYKPTPRVYKALRRKLRFLHKPGEISVSLGFVDTQLPPKRSLLSSEWDLFFQHIHTSRLSRKTPRSVQKSALVARVGEEQIGFTRALHPKG